MGDDGFHEIQLGKKQLVFSFMAAAVFTVVVFLIGVWVGRDIRRSDNEIVPDLPTADVTADAAQPPTQVAPKDLDYASRLQSSDPKTESKADLPAKSAEPPTPAAESGPPAAAPKPADPLPAKTTPPAAEKAAVPAPAPVSGGWFVQVGAFGTSGPADTLMDGLKKKGYAAYVFTAPAAPTPFKVRVGPFADRGAADAVSARLKKEEGLSPLVQR